MQIIERLFKWANHGLFLFILVLFTQHVVEKTLPVAVVAMIDQYFNFNLLLTSCVHITC